MNVKGLITDAIYKSLQDREHQRTIDSGYEAFALYTLNILLDEWRDKIPFAQESTFTDVNQLTGTKYLSVSNVNFVLGNVQMPLEQVSLNKFNYIQTVLGLNSLPQVWYFDELLQNILVYPTPNMPSYQFTVWGRQQQATLAITDSLPTNMPPFMANALIHELAFRLCAEYGVEWSDTKEQVRQGLLKLLDGKKSVDLSAPLTCDFGRPNTRNIPPFPYFYYLSGGGR